MTLPRLPRRRRPRRPLEALATIWSAASSVTPMSVGAAAAYQALVLSMRRVVIGRTLRLRLGGEDFRLTVTEIVSLLDPRALLPARLDVRVSAADIRWGDQLFGCANLVMRNIRLRPGSFPAMEATPVELTLDVPSDAVHDLLRSTRPSLSGEIGGDGVARVRWARRPTWGSVEIDVALDDAAEAVKVHLKPRALNIGRRRWSLPARTPGRRLTLTALPPGLRLQDVRLESHRVRVRAVLPQWHMPVPRAGRSARDAD